MNVWKKLFGITGGVRPAADLQSALEAPGIPDSWNRIQAQAEKNAEAYEAAFPCVPRSYTGRLREDGSQEKGSILPTWNPGAAPPSAAAWKTGNLASPMPFQPEFWTAPQHNPAAVKQLSGIKGFITALPIHWTEGENVRFEFPTALVADNGLPQGTLPDALSSPSNANTLAARTERQAVEGDA
jgi:phospholipase D1/2